MTKNEKIIRMGISVKAHDSPFISNSEIAKMFDVHRTTATIYINEFAEHVGDDKLYPDCTLIVTGDKKRRQRVGLYAFVHYMTYRRWIIEEKWDMVPKFDVFDIKKGIGNIQIESSVERDIEELKQAVKLEVQIQVAKALQQELGLAM